MTLGEKIKDQRYKIGLKQSELAQKLGVSSSAVGNWEQDINKPNVDLISNMCHIFSVSPDYFFDIKIKKNPPQKRRMSPEEKQEFTRDLTALLDRFGFVGENGDISDADLEMLKGIVMLLVAYRQHRSNGE